MPVARSETYPPKITEFARRLYADGAGKSISDIRTALEKRGYTPKRDTIRYWVDDEYREEKLHRQRRYRPHGPPPKRGWRLRLDRMEELRHKVRLSYRDIARLMSHDYKDLDLSGCQVEHILKCDTKPRTIRRLLSPKGAVA